jgi:lipoprotein-anchoring transpeptidase ErfK/SrfK
MDPATIPSRRMTPFRERHARLRMRPRLIGLAIAALWATLPTASAQFGTPEEWRRTDPTMQDRDPGYVPPEHATALDPAYQRQPVFYRTHETPGTIIIDTSERFLYLIQGNNVALRYGIGVGRDGFQWQGLLRISRKAEWPDWTPPAEMIQRQPYLPRFMAGGPGNPLGARALYLGNTVYRIHGTNAPETIGQAVSSGCFRLVNDEIIDLFDRVPVGTKVIIQQ